jgi:hypothetical protein
LGRGEVISEQPACNPCSGDDFRIGHRMLRRLPVATGLNVGPQASAVRRF